MVLNNPETTVGYFCPACGTGVISMIGAFRLQGDLLRLKCPCGQSALQITMGEHSDLIQLQIPCYVCPSPHRYQVKKETFFGTELLCLPCSLSGFDACFIGKKEKVCAAMDETEGQLLESLQQAGLDIEPGERLTDVAQRQLHVEKSPFEGDGTFDAEKNFDDNHIMDMVRFVIRDMIEGGDVSCRCPAGEGEYSFSLGSDGITVRCEKCGASRTVSCNSSLEANAFLESAKLVLE